VLVPTKELALQVVGFLKKLTVYCEGLIGVCNLSSGGASLQRYVLRRGWMLS
jgi:ATP-dependent RNA helicase DDX56/DBP9